MIRLLLLDNHDSFTYNLAELLRKSAKVTFEIHTATTLAGIDPQKFDKFLFSPGPGIPQEHPAIFELLTLYGTSKSFLGICLGLQAIALHYGGELFNLEQVVHGQVKRVRYEEENPHHLFRHIPNPFDVGLYHSWAVRKESLPADLRITALSEDGIIMGVTHKTYDVAGVQFHPESIMTPYGKQLLDNWLNA